MADRALFTPSARRRSRQPRPATLTVEFGRRTAWLHGEQIVGLLAAADVPVRQWDPLRRCWMVPVDRADDVVSAAEYLQKRVVTVTAVDR